MTPRPEYPSHLVPRTRNGRIALVLFVALFALCMPPVTHLLLDRVEPWLLGAPFFMTALFFVYVALIGVLVWAYRKDV